MIETSELQAVDFAIGAYIAAAFTGHNPNTGPKEWQGFLARPTNRQIFRYDGDMPADVLKAVLKQKAGARAADGKTTNAVDLPLAYYTRKPGLTNGDQYGNVRGRWGYNDALSNAYQLEVLPCQLEYTLRFASWDKPSLDKLCLAWYRHAAFNDAFTVPYRLGADVFDVRAAINDHKAVLLTDESKQRSEGRLFMVSTSLTVNTQLIFGEGATPADPVTVIFNMTEFIR